MIELNKKLYNVLSDEFKTIHHEQYNNLIIKDKLGFCERIISLLCELSTTLNINQCVFYNQTHGGFIPIHCSSSFKSMVILKTESNHIYNIVQNSAAYNVCNILWTQENVDENCIIFSENGEFIDENLITNFKPIILTETNTKIIENNSDYHVYSLSNTNLSLYIPINCYEKFTKDFYYYMDENTKILDYDNLIHLCIMVKDGGSIFEEMLTENLDIIDRWTILDTGSTDGTIETINRLLVGKKKGTLYQEPFINFRESRNRCLELAGTVCKYNLMLDDTYIIKGNLRAFLNEIRGDQFGDSYSLNVKSFDVEYISNRITKSQNKLRYIYTMHEVIQDENNINIKVPYDVSFIEDRMNEYMSNRSDYRKEYDLKCLNEMIEEFPEEPRHLFYMAQTHKMLRNFEKAAEYYYKRAFFHVDGFDQEKHDALFEFTRISIYELKKPWKEYEKYYKLCTEWQPTRPEGDYFLGIHYFLDGITDIAYDYFKKAFIIGYPAHQQYSLKPTLSYHFVPYYLSSLCYQHKDYKLGLESTTLFLEKNKPTDNFYGLMLDWYKIYSMLTKMPPVIDKPKNFDKPIFCIVADGGFTQWSGSNILTTGVGGSETWVIETARYINKLTDYEVIVFCNCKEEEIFEQVKYIQLSRYLQVISEIKIAHCIISRFSEYIPASIEGHVENIHLILHDLQLSGNVIPIHPKIKNIFCLTEWHKTHFLETFPQFTDITHPLHYGIDFTNFLNVKEQNNTDYVEKIPYSFIYSSFPNRGLLVVLKMWPRIVERYNKATLHIFTDVNNEWANTNYPDELKEIREILDLYKGTDFYPTSVINHGWVDKKTLAKFWKQSLIWLYPCKFKETFCLTALEAALTKTLAITNDLAALQDTVGDRGVIIPGDASSEEWKTAAFDKICEVIDNPLIAEQFIEKNYKWALTHSWKTRTEYLLQNHIFLKKEEKENITMTLTLNENTESGLNSIDKIYYINLSKREDRRKHFLNQVKTNNIPEEKIVRFEAINGVEYNFSQNELSLFQKANYLYMPTKLQIMGNQLSHLKIFQEMIERKYKYIIVCQDDIVFKSGFNEYIDKIVQDLPEDAEIIHFGFHKYAVRDVFLPWDLNNKNKIYDDELSYKNINSNICKLRPDFNALYHSNNSTGYILTLNGAKNYVDYALKNGFKYATDCEMNDYLISKDIYYGSTTVLATTFPYLGSDVFENMYNNDTLNNPHKLTINNDFLNYADMYNWTNDLPENTKAKITFIEMLSQFITYNSCEILEIGTFAGTSVIGMLQYLPNAKATTIDPWISYLEKECATEINTHSLEKIEQMNVEMIFHENIFKAGFKEKVTAIKGDSAFVLIDLIKNGKHFDFIYVDGSHKAIDCYTDCLLGWELLNMNGIMGIDDYLYKISLTNELENVMKGVDHFLEKIKGQYIILEKGYRVFIKKIQLINLLANDFLETKYNLLCNTTSDINEHLPTLYKYASNCDSVLELGVRGCVSSWAFLKGLNDNKNNNTTKHLFLNDIEKCDIQDLLNVSRDLNITMDYEWLNDLNLDFKDRKFDLTFIDTWHIYGQLKRELAMFSLLTKKYIILHDTTVDAEKGETIRLGLDSKKQSLKSGYLLEEIEQGLQKAINEFLFVNREWRLKEKFENNNGLTILERIFQ
jgi:GR25 family glycosyltransferase involved in LPS biosynthesis/predicted O-methyltransferase YrrM